MERSRAPGTRPDIRKVGTLDLDIVETTPVVWQGRLLRFEFVRKDYWANRTGRSHYRFVDVESGQATAPFAWDYGFGSAYVDGETMCAFGTVQGGGPRLDVLRSSDLEQWSAQTALDLPGWGIYNQSVCQGAGRYMMAFEVGEPEALVGNRFTNFFAESQDLLSWQVLSPETHAFARDRYTACPVIRYLADGYYYMIYLECVPLYPQKPRSEWRTEECTYESHIVRTRDFVAWESSPHNPVLKASPEDRLIANAAFTPGQRERIALAVNRNNSDVDLCEYGGRVVILYSWGAQTGTEFLAQAVCEGTLEQFFQGFFPS